MVKPEMVPRVNPGETGLWHRSMPSHTTKVWATVDEACAALGIGKTVLWSLQKNKLVPGKHWVYLSGKERSLVGWDIPAIAEWQREQTAAIFQATKAKAAAVESYQEGN